MYKRIIATVIKEWLLLSRDIGGLLVLLVMPATLIFIMSLVQDAPFREYQELKLEILIADDDGAALSASIMESLRSSNAFKLTDSIDGRALSEGLLRERLRTGKERIGLIIPKGATAEIVNAANTVANSLAAQFGSPPLPQRPARDSVAIRLLFDPVSRPAFRLAIHAALDKAVSGASTKFVLSRISRLAGSPDSAQGPDFQQLLAGLAIREEQVAGAEAGSNQVSSVQHNVPAWAIFGMFFIVLPLSGQIIRERDDSSALRVKLIPDAAFGVAIGRILANTIICCLQFAAMCAVGLWVLPWAGLPALTLGAHPLLLFPVVVATALCATAYGNLVGTLFRSHTQALSFGAISIVILSALGGIWVPVELLTPILQSVAKISPLHWSLQGIQAVILRNASWRDILLPMGILLSLASVLYALSIWREQGSRVSS